MGPTFTRLVHKPLAVLSLYNQLCIILAFVKIDDNQFYFYVVHFVLHFKFLDSQGHIVESCSVQRMCVMWNWVIVWLVPNYGIWVVPNYGKDRSGTIRLKQFLKKDWSKAYRLLYTHIHTHTNTLTHIHTN